jgi:hypothetical protein
MQVHSAVVTRSLTRCVLHIRANPVLNFELGGVGVNPFEVNKSHAHCALQHSGCSFRPTDLLAHLFSTLT